jgi:1,4-dihydroxy-2-naphthoate octaprenyltransferase
MMSKGVRAWIEAARLRTLPLALSSIIIGSALAAFDGAFNVHVLILAALTAVFLQILSNLANDYGDAVKGTDNAGRVGPVRAVQSGTITPALMGKGIAATAVVAVCMGMWLICAGLRGLSWLYYVSFVLLGLVSVAAALTYTLGRKPYGYSGFGDVSVFLFFGQAGVLGAYFLHRHELSWGAALMASVLGLFSMGVLNLNNMRDMENDQRCGKITIAVRLGLARAKIYHAFLIAAGLLGAAFFTVLYFISAKQLLIFLIFPVFLRDVHAILNTRENSELDSFLKKLSLTTFIFSILFGAGLILSLC